MTKKIGGRGESKTSPRRIESAKKQARALELRQDGNTYQQIATALGYTTYQSAYDAVTAALARTVEEPAAEFRKVVGERLHVALKAIWRKVAKGDPEAIKTFLQIHDRMAKLWGLNKQIDVNVNAEQLNVQNNIQTNVNLQFDLTKLSEEQLGQYEQLLASWSTLLTSVATGTGGAEGRPSNGTSAPGNGHPA